MLSVSIRMTQVHLLKKISKLALCFYRPFLTSLRNTNDLLGTWFLKLLDFGSTINSAAPSKAIPMYEVFMKWPYSLSLATWLL